MTARPTTTVSAHPCSWFSKRKSRTWTAPDFARETGLAKIAANVDSSVLFVYPTAEGGWAGADESFYASVISEIKMIQTYKDGIVENFDFFTQTFKGYFVRGAVFRADIYSFGASADYVAKHLLKPCRANTSGAPVKSPPPCAPWSGSAWCRMCSARTFPSSASATALKSTAPSTAASTC